MLWDDVYSYWCFAPAHDVVCYILQRLYGCPRMCRYDSTGLSNGISATAFWYRLLVLDIDMFCISRVEIRYNFLEMYNYSLFPIHICSVFLSILHRPSIKLPRRPSSVSRSRLSTHTAMWTHEMNIIEQGRCVTAIVFKLIK